jgi:(2Fe-2S) ferredoxin
MSKHDDEDTLRILVCNGKHCKENKSKKLRSRLNDLVEERGLAHLVTVDSANCLGKCKSGPVVRIQPIGKVLTEVKPKHAEEVLNAALQKTDILPSTDTASE